jgi:chaperonin GroEL
MLTIHTETDLSKIIKGINKAADIIVSTMSSKGKNVIIANSRGKQRFTQDGVSVAKSIKFKDEIENIGAQLVISSCQKTVDERGDGTTLTALMVKEFVNVLHEKINSGLDINCTTNLLDEEIKIILKKIKDGSKKVKNGKMIREIATTAGKSSFIGDLFYHVYKETGLNANIKVEKTDELNYTTFDVKSGFEIRNGFAHTAFMTDKNTETCMYENVTVKTFKRDLSTVDEELMDVIGVNKSQNKPLLIFAPKFGDSVIRYCTMAKLNSGVQIVLVKSGGWGEMIKRNLIDIDAFTDSGSVDKIIVTPFSTTLLNNKSDSCKERIEQLKKLKQSAIELIDRRDYQERIDNLSGTGVIIFVGGNTEESKNEEFDRIEDAVGAVKSAIEGGVVEGAGYSLFKNTLDLEYGFQFIIPYYTILMNANLKVTHNRVDLTTELPIKSYFDVGVLDAYKTIESALKNAFTTAKLLVNTTYTIYNKLDD